MNSISYVSSVSCHACTSFIRRLKTLTIFFLTATPLEGKKFEIVIKAARRSDGRCRVDPDVVVGSTMVISHSDLVSLSVSKSDFLSMELKTERAAQKKCVNHVNGRELTAVNASAWLIEDTAVVDSLDTPVGQWDQFDANKKLFKVKSSYDENIYTKKLDKSTLSKAQIAKAERVARY